jgi:hypothetical protein
MKNSRGEATLVSNCRSAGNFETLSYDCVYFWKSRTEAHVSFTHIPMRCQNRNGDGYASRSPTFEVLGAEAENVHDGGLCIILGEKRERLEGT